MEQHLSPESLQLIANLINDKNRDLKEHLESKYEDLYNHISKEIRMVKTTVQENHAIASETRELARKTNGRVTKVENEIYGERDHAGDVIKGKEGIINKMYKGRKHIIYAVAGLLLLMLTLQYPPLSKLIGTFIDKIS